MLLYFEKFKLTLIVFVGSSKGVETVGVHSDTLNVSSNLVQILQGHQSEVFTCVWSPLGNILATGYVLWSVNLDFYLKHIVTFMCLQ